MPAEDPLDSGTVAGEPRDGRLTTREPWAVVALVAVAWFVVFGGRFVLPAFGVQIQESLDMTNREFGIAITVLWACYSTMQFPSGVLSDDLGYRPVLVGGALLMGIGFAALSSVWTFVAFVLVAAVIGIATGLMTTPMLSLVSELFSDRKGLPQSEANALLSLFFLAGVVVKPVTGWLSDVVPRRLLASASMALAGVALATLTTVDAPIGVFALFAVCGTFLMAFPPVMQAYLMDLFAGDGVGGAFGLSRTTFILVGSTGPAAIGFGSDIASFDAVFVALGAGLLVSGGLLLVTMRYIGGS